MSKATIEEKRLPKGGASLRQSVTEAIRAAVLAALVEEGHARMSMDSVARRAGVGKAALYRRWTSKLSMITEVIRDSVGDSLLRVPETGALSSDVRELLVLFREELRDPRLRRIVADLIGESTRNEALYDMFDESIAKPRRLAVQGMLRAAIERGELPEDLDLEMAVDLLIAPVAFRLILLRDPMDDDRLEALARSVSAGLAARTAA